MKLKEPLTQWRISTIMEIYGVSREDAVKLKAGMDTDDLSVTSDTTVNYEEGKDVDV